MSIFLVTFDRRRQQPIQIRDFPPGCRAEAEAARFQAEREALETGQVDLEIVTLEADSLDELRQTHSSYFPETIPAIPA
jgi:hypothetical protein